MLFRSLLAGLALATVATDSEAGPFRRRAQPAYQPAAQPVYQAPAYQQPSAVVPSGEYVSYYSPTVTSADGVVTSSSPVAMPAAEASDGFAGDALDEVNAKRAARGLRPFVRDEGLMQAARACAAHRAAYGIFGHSSNDFAFVPPGTYASSAGCAAYPASYGWMSCCVYDNYTYGGAAYVTGRDGKRYMHLFVR